MFIDEVRLYFFCVRIMDGERIDGVFGLLEIGNSGLVLIMVLILFIKVLRILKVKFLGLFFNSRVFKI